MALVGFDILDDRPGDAAPGRNDLMLGPLHLGEHLRRPRPELAQADDGGRYGSPRNSFRQGFNCNAFNPSARTCRPCPEAVAAFKQALAEARAAGDRLRRVLEEDGWLE